MTVAVRLVGEAVQVGDALPGLRVEVTPRTVVMGASASRDWQPQHHDHVHCVQVANLPDIFLNTPHQAGFMERYLTDWGGPHLRLVKLGFRMKKSVVPGDTMVFTGEVAEVELRDAVARVVIDIELRAGDDVATLCRATVELPRTADDNPWDHTLQPGA